MKKKSVAILGILVILLSTSAYFYISTRPHIIHESKQGVITKIEGNTITLDHQHSYMIENAEDFFVTDTVKIDISYEEEKVDTTLQIEQIELISRSEEDIRVHQVFSSLSLEEKVAQMFMVRCPTDDPLQQLTTYQMGGYILFDANINPFTKEQFIEQNRAFQDASNTGLLIGIDEEGGSVVRLSRYTRFRDTRFASPQVLYQQGGWENIIHDTLEKCAFLHELGINLNFAPVADISTNAADFIYDRTLGQDASATAHYIELVTTAMKNNQMGSVLKHFPGYGNNADTHTGSALDKRPYDQFVNEDFLPFLSGIQAGADCVLMSHNIITSMDEAYPASLSVQVHELLRNDLHFDGIIITDDLVMKAITQQYTPQEAAVLAVEAGNDMLISSDHEVQIQAVLDAVKKGVLSESRIDESVMRILHLKYRLNVLKP